MSPETMPPIHFLKRTGTATIFIMIDNRKRSIDADRWQDLVRHAWRRKLSVGTDEMILLELER